MAKTKTKPKPKAAKKKTAKKGASKARSVKRAKPKAAAKAKPKPARGGAKRSASRKGAGDGVLGRLEFDNGADEPTTAVVTLNGMPTPPMPPAPAGQNATVESVNWTSAANSTASQVAANVRGMSTGTRTAQNFTFTQPPLARIDRLVVSLAAGALALTAFDANGAQLPIH